MKKVIFNNIQLKKKEQILSSQLSYLNSMSGREIKDIVIAWTYYSGRIEGSTYTYIETDCLLRDGITASKPYEHAKMLKNLYNTLMSEYEYIVKQKNIEKIDTKTILRLHFQISNELVSREECGNYRNRSVMITGTNYIPPKNKQEICLKLEELLYSLDYIDCPFEKAIFTHCNIARIQPFIDCNKRMARMLETIIMANANLAPIYSTKDEDFINYRNAIVHFYETEDYSKYIDFFLNKQIERLKLLDINFDIYKTKKEKIKPKFKL